ncbi:uncharacterized protein C12orf56 homolog [Betta splendens]|uniref:Uncharacterized protein C12orf56 homolog n=1 Tax=Betta splendens TaxID=158456 RepID=A0A6P7NPZ0_BETSP|nr:uncharacterized protein C12orf56 homolog [Betta splendens]
MARTGSGSGPLLLRRNVKLDSFLKRNTDRDLYERIRTCEPCVVVSESVSRVFMHVVLSDECLYLTEYAPRTLTAAVSFARVRDIKLVNDLPDFLSGKDRERCQHIRIVYAARRPARRRRHWFGRDGKPGPAPSALSSRRSSHCPTASDAAVACPAQRDPGEWRKERRLRSASCPNPETLGLVRVPHPPTQPHPATPTSPQEPSQERGLGSVLTRWMQADCGAAEAELHLYAVSQTSRLYLHLQSLWRSSLIRSTLLLEPLHRRGSASAAASAPARPRPASSWEGTTRLLAQLSAALLQDGLGAEGLYLLLRELRAAARHSVALRRLFWRSSEVCLFLVQTLEESLGGCQSPGGGYTPDQLLLSTAIVQTLAVMFRGTEVEAARVNQLSAKKGALASRMLLALICDPQPEAHAQGPLLCSQALLSKYLDAACSLLFELLLVGDESRCFSAGSLLSLGWMLQALQPHPHLLAFVGHQAQQVALALSDLQEPALSPLQAVLLFQRCRLLLACLQHSGRLAQHLRSHFREEFRYFVKPSCVEEKLPPCYPISRPTLQLVAHILTLMLQE